MEDVFLSGSVAPMEPPNAYLEGPGELTPVESGLVWWVSIAAMTVRTAGARGAVNRNASGRTKKDFVKVFPDVRHAVWIGGGVVALRRAKAIVRG